MGLNACPSVQKPGFCFFAETRHRVGEKRDRCEAEVLFGDGRRSCLWSGRASPWELGRADRKDKARDKRWYLPCHSGKQRATKALSRGIRRLVRDDDDDEGVEGRGRRRLDAWSRGRTPMSDKGGKRPKQCREGGRKKGQVRSTRQTKNDVRVRAPGGRDERRGIKTETRRLSEGVWN